MTRFSTVYRDNRVILYSGISVHRSRKPYFHGHGHKTGHFDDITARISAYNNTECVYADPYTALVVRPGKRRCYCSAKQIWTISTRVRQLNQLNTEDLANTGFVLLSLAFSRVKQ